MYKRWTATSVFVAGGLCAGVLWAAQVGNDVVSWPFGTQVRSPATAASDAAAGRGGALSPRWRGAHLPPRSWANAAEDAHPRGRSRDGIGTTLAALPASASASALALPTYSLTGPEYYIDPAAAEARSIAVGDVSGDGRDDLVFLSLRSSPNSGESRVEIHAAYQRADGSLGAAVKIGESDGGIAYQLLVADLDRDGVGDVITTNVDGVLVLRSNADGTFTPSSRITGTPLDLTVSDVDRDGHLDILVDSSNTWATVVHGDGSGAITRTSGLPLPSSAVRAVGDVTGDGLDDLILATIFNRPLQEFHIYPALASGGYGAPVVLSQPIDANQTRSLVVGNFNADGRADLVLDEAKVDASPRVYLQDAQGGFGPSTPLERRSGSGFLLATDLNRDGLTDLAIEHTGWGYVGYYLQTSTGFTTEDAIDTHQNMGRKNHFATGDLNHDGCGDLVVAHGSSPVLLYGQGCAPPRVTACCSRPIPVAGSAMGLAAATPLVRARDGDSGPSTGEGPTSGRHSGWVRDGRARTLSSKPVHTSNIPVLKP